MVSMKTRKWCFKVRRVVVFRKSLKVLLETLPLWCCRQICACSDLQKMCSFFRVHNYLKYSWTPCRETSRSEKLAILERTTVHEARTLAIGTVFAVALQPLLLELNSKIFSYLAQFPSYLWVPHTVLFSQIMQQLPSSAPRFEKKECAWATSWHAISFPGGAKLSSPKEEHYFAHCVVARRFQAWIWRKMRERGRSSLL